MIKQKFLILFLLFWFIQVFLFVIMADSVKAIDSTYCDPLCPAGTTCVDNKCVPVNTGVGAADPGGSGSGSGGVAGKLDNPLGVSDPRIIVGNVIKAALGLAGSLALGVFILGGLFWVTSAGSEEKVTRGKNMIMWATFGLGVIFTSYALVNFVIKALTGT